MADKTHLWLEDPVASNGTITSRAVLESPARKRFELWYRLPLEHRAALTRRGDPFLVGLLFTAMRYGADLVVHGEVSPSLLQNLEEFQAVWACWRPDQYRPVEISADLEREPDPDHRAGKAVMAFSGGVDSAFTAWRHQAGRAGRLNQPLQAGMMVHGFDIPLEQSNDFNRAAENARLMLASLDMTLIPLATNFREQGDVAFWNEAHGTALASCLMLLQGDYNAGLVPSSEPYNGQFVAMHWGSNPLTDRLLSSLSFQIIHDGAAFNRGQKIAAIAGWPEAMQYLRVCYIGQEKYRNCCQCEKCIRTMLNIRAQGLSRPACFEHDVSDAQIANLELMHPIQMTELERILATAQANAITASWVTALEKSVRRNRLKFSGRRTLWQKVRDTALVRKTAPARQQLRRLLLRPRPASSD